MVLALLSLTFVVAGALPHEHASAGEAPVALTQHEHDTHKHVAPSGDGRATGDVCCEALAAMCAGAMLRPDEAAHGRPGFNHAMAWPAACVAPVGRQPEAESPPPRV